MKKCLLILLALVTLTMAMPMSVAAGTDEMSVKITAPEKRVPLDEPLEITVTFTGLDETVEEISIGAPGFSITDSRGNTKRSNFVLKPEDLPEEAFGADSYEETFTLEWSVGDLMSSTVMMISLHGEGYGRIETNADGSYVLDNPYSDSCWVSLNDKYIAFSAESEEDAAKKLEANLAPWVIGACGIGLVIVAVVVIILLHVKSGKKVKNEVTANE